MLKAAKEASRRLARRHLALCGRACRRRGCAALRSAPRRHINLKAEYIA